MQDALDRASAGRTTITVAHRLSTIRDADQIIVLTAGHILESAMTTDEGTAHTRLLRNPEGAYSKLVAAQKIREEEAAAEAEADDDEADHAPVPGELTREQIDEMARREKPQFEQLKRAGTGRSLASEVLERRQDDIEAAGGDLPKHYSTFTLFARMYKLNREYWRRYVFAFMGAVASGCVVRRLSFYFPLLSLFAHARVLNANFVARRSTLVRLEHRPSLADDPPLRRSSSSCFFLS